jgi:hypothetical protein
MNNIEHLYDFLVEARKIPSFGTSDERLRDGGWWVVTICSTNRDADALTEANHLALANILDAVDPDGAHHDVMHASHWGVGWCDQFIIDPTHEPTARAVAEAGCALSDYPVLNESLYSDIEARRHEDERCDEGCSHCEHERDIPPDGCAVSRDVTVWIDEDCSTLGPAATQSDLKAYQQSLADHLAERFPGRSISVETVLGGERAGRVSTDDEIAEYVRELHSGDGWVDLLPDSEENGPFDTEREAIADARGR